MHYSLLRIIVLALLSLAMISHVVAHPASGPGDALGSASTSGLASTNATIARYRVDYRVHSDASSESTETYEIILNTKAAVEQFSQIRLAYNGAMESLEVPEAFTISLDGKRQRVPESSIYEQEGYSSASAPMYPGQKVKVIVFPNMVEGSRIAYQVRRTQRVPYFPGYFSFWNHFSIFEDVDDAQVTLTAPKGMPMFLKSRGMDGGVRRTLEDGSSRWQWTLRTREPMKAQHWAADTREYSPYVMASSYKSWSQVAEAYQIKAGPAAEVTAKSQALADRITTGIIDRRGQADALYRWVTSNIRYVAIYLGNGGLEPNSADSIIDNGYGDCKDHVVLLQSLLAAKGIESSPALVSLESGPTLPDVPVLGYFNHVIVHVPEFALYLDSTAQWARFGQLHGGILDSPALHTRTAVLARTPADDGGGNHIAVEVVWNIDEKGNAEGEAKMSVSPQYESEMRAKLSRLTDQNREQAEQSLMGLAGLKGQAQLHLEGRAGDLTRAFRYSTAFQVERFIDVGSAGSVVTPKAPVGFEVIQNRDGSALPRTNDVPFSCSERTQTVTHRMRFPDDLPIISVPSSRTLRNAAGEYRMKWTRQAQQVTIRHELHTRAARGVGRLCEPEDYPAARELLDAVADGFRESMKIGARAPVDE